MTAHFKRGPHLPVFQGCQGKERKKKREINQAFTHSQTTQHKRKRKNNFKKKAQFRKESESIETCKRRQNDILREHLRSLLDDRNSTQRGTSDDTNTLHVPSAQPRAATNSDEADKTVSTSRKNVGALDKKTNRLLVTTTSRKV